MVNQVAIKFTDSDEVISVKNLQFLLLYYPIPYKVLREKKELVRIPRNPRQVARSEKWRKVVESDDFLSVVVDAVAFFVWSAFDVSEYIHIFSGDDPLYRLAIALPIWQDAYNDLFSPITHVMKYQPSNERSPFPSPEQAFELFYRIGKYGISKNNLQPIIDCVKQNRCHEDFDRRKSKQKKAFYRKWNHSGARTKVMMAGSLTKDLNNFISNKPRQDDYYDKLAVYNSYRFEDDTVIKMDFDKYLGKLDQRNRDIVTLKCEGKTQKEIATALGYKTHSAVGKRINGPIRREFDEHFSIDQTLI